MLYYYGQRIRRMTKPGREADDLGHMLAKMMAAQMAGAAAAGGAGAAAGATGPGEAGAGPAGQTKAREAQQEEKNDKEVMAEYGTTQKRADDEEAVLESQPTLYRTTTDATVRSMEELVEAEYAPVAPDLKSDHGH